MITAFRDFFLFFMSKVEHQKVVRLSMWDDRKLVIDKYKAGNEYKKCDSD